MLHNLTPTPFISDLKTSIGNQLLEKLEQDGWTIRSQYDENAIDKGIDYNFFELVKGSMVALMEWDNWGEWSISANDPDAQASITQHIKAIESHGN